MVPAEYRRGRSRAPRGDPAHWAAIDEAVRQMIDPLLTHASSRRSSGSCSRRCWATGSARALYAARRVYRALVDTTASTPHCRPSSPMRTPDAGSRRSRMSRRWRRPCATSRRVRCRRARSRECAIAAAIIDGLCAPPTPGGDGGAAAEGRRRRGMPPREASGSGSAVGRPSERLPGGSAASDEGGGSDGGRGRRHWEEPLREQQQRRRRRKSADRVKRSGQVLSRMYSSAASAGSAESECERQRAVYPLFVRCDSDILH